MTEPLRDFAGDWLAGADLPALRRRLLEWYDRHGRDLPWRRTGDPYAVWVSEVMLQQTTVAAVRERYARFLERFPTVAVLAAAAEADVLGEWQGLGYYRRARNLHAAARRIVAEHEGRFPTGLADVLALPGLGDYAARAVLCFACDQRWPVLEANTVRLWARLAGVDVPCEPVAVRRQLWRLAEAVLPRERFADTNQALMDLGATVCTPRKPDCQRCPLRPDCVAYATGRPEALPVRPPRSVPTAIDRVSVVLRCGVHVLIVQRPPTGQWANLWELPSADRTGAEDWLATAERALRGVCDAPATLGGLRQTVRHGITRYRVQLRCYEARTADADRLPAVTEPARWVRPDDLASYAFGTPQRRLLEGLDAAPP